MGNFDKQKTEWGRIVRQGNAGYCFDSERLASGVFCIHLADCGGESMACLSQVEVTGYFNSWPDALGYLRFAELPRVLDWDTDTQQEPLPVWADGYLHKYETEKREQIDHLIGLIDRALMSETVSAGQLSLLRDQFNATFADANPQIEILAWGSLTRTLSSDYFRESFDDAILDEAEEEEKPSTELKTLLVSGNFNEDDAWHLSLARDFFEKHMSA